MSHERYLNKKRNIIISIQKQNNLYYSFYIDISYISLYIMYKAPLCDNRCESGGRMVHPIVTYGSPSGDVWCCFAF